MCFKGVSSHVKEFFHLYIQNNLGEDSYCCVCFSFFFSSSFGRPPGGKVDLLIWKYIFLFFSICSLSSLHVSRWLYFYRSRWILIFFMQITIWVPCFMLLSSFLLMEFQRCPWLFKGLKSSTNKNILFLPSLGKCNSSKYFKCSYFICGISSLDMS